MNIRIRAWMLIMLGIPGISVGRPVETGFLNRSVSIEGTVHRYQVYVPATYRQSVIDWFEFRPKIDYRPITGWKFRASPDGGEVEHAQETGLRNGWQNIEQGDTGWTEVTLPGLWEDHPRGQYNGWEWLKTHLYLPAGAAGKALILTMGRINHQDSTYINGILVGSEKGHRAFRSYSIKPGDAAYAALKFGGDNVVAIQVFYEGDGGGLYADQPTIGIEGSELAWTAIDPRTGASLQFPQRHGVVSWGRGNFFNSWETSRGAFGFRIEGKGVEFAGPLAGIAPLQVATTEAFTDFAISKPWLFQALAYTRTQRKLLFPDNGERYPSAARIVNMKTGGELILIPASLARTPTGLAVMKRLQIDFESMPKL